MYKTVFTGYVKTNSIIKFYPFFDYQITEIKATVYFSIEGTKIYEFKNDSIVDAIDDCFRGNLDEKGLKEFSNKDDYNFTSADLDNCVKENTPYRTSMTAQVIPEITSWMPKFKEKYNNLSESDFQLFAKIRSHYTDSEFLKVLLFNSNGDTLKLTSEYPYSNYHMPWEIEYDNGKVKLYNITIFECFKPLFRVINWNDDTQRQKEMLLYLLVRALYHDENPTK